MTVPVFSFAYVSGFLGFQLAGALILILGENRGSFPEAQKNHIGYLPGTLVLLPECMESVKPRG